MLKGQDATARDKMRLPLTHSTQEESRLRPFSGPGVSRQRTRRAFLQTAIASLAGCWLAASPLPAKAEKPPALPYVYDNNLDEDRNRLESQTGAFVCLLNTSHPSRFPDRFDYIHKLKQVSQDLTGIPCLVLHYTYLDRIDILKPNLAALVIDPPGKAISVEYYDMLGKLIRACQAPTIGFCGGMHRIVQAYGGRVAPMRRLYPGERDPHPAYYPGFFKEWGYMPVQVLVPDPLFDGLPETLVVQEMHYAETKRLSDEFTVLASRDTCQIQAIKHRDKPLYATQFHPEHHDLRHPHGRILLQNFFSIAGLVG